MLIRLHQRYKPLGRNRGGVKGRPDGFESYAVWASYYALSFYLLSLT